jgi:hypothetical protein
MGLVNSTNRLPDTKLLAFMSRTQLLVVWRDILYVLNNLPTHPMKRGRKEHYLAYAIVNYLYLVKEGSQPNEESITIEYRPNFCYVGKFDTWFNSAVLRKCLVKQHMVNDGNYELGSVYVDKLLEKEEEKGNVFNQVVTKELLIKQLNSATINKDLAVCAVKLLTEGNTEGCRFMKPAEELS